MCGGEGASLLDPEGLGHRSLTGAALGCDSVPLPLPLQAPLVPRGHVAQVAEPPAQQPGPAAFGVP